MNNTKVAFFVEENGYLAFDKLTHFASSERETMMGDCFGCLFTCFGAVRFVYFFLF
jgi:hypothetical protein